MFIFVKKIIMYKEVQDWLNSFSSKEKLENEYIPEIKIQKTVKPKEESTFNEVFENVHEQLKTK